MQPREGADRREFLTGKAAMNAAQRILALRQGELVDDSSVHDTAATTTPVANTAARNGSPPQAQYLPLLHVARRAMATQFEAFLPAECKAPAVDAASDAFEELESLEQIMSFYRTTSDLVLLNRIAKSGWVEVGDALFDVLCKSLDFHNSTLGAFDVASGPLTRLWRMARSQGKHPSHEELAGALACASSLNIQFDHAKKAVRFAREGTEVDLGAIGKGYALDVCARLMQNRGVASAVLHGGQSSVLVWGGRPDTEGKMRPWKIGVGHPLKPEARVAELNLCDGAIGTSGSARQFYYVDGRRLCHVIDPRTGLPVEGIWSATVIAATAAAADALSTALFVLGPEGARTVYEQRRDFSALFVLPGKSSHSVELVTINMEKVDWTAV